jgi:hypothetical protein
MHPLVRRQVALDTRAVVAMSTLKGLLPSVHPQVRRQVALVTRAVVAMSTLKGLLSSVHPQVHRQAALVTRAVVAMSTLKGLLPIVQPQVPRQAAHLGGLIPTVLALVDHHLFLSEVRSCRTTDVPATDEPPLGLPLMVLIKRAVQPQWPADCCLVLAQHLSLSAHWPSFLLIACLSLATSHLPLELVCALADLITCPSLATSHLPLELVCALADLIACPSLATSHLPLELVCALADLIACPSLATSHLRASLFTFFVVVLIICVHSRLLSCASALAHPYLAALLGVTSLATQVRTLWAHFSWAIPPQDLSLVATQSEQASGRVFAVDFRN